MTVFFCVVEFVLVLDIGAYFSVPGEIRIKNLWALIPGCGFVLFVAYHFGNKIKAPNSGVTGAEPEAKRPR